MEGELRNIFKCNVDLVPSSCAAHGERPPAPAVKPSPLCAAVAAVAALSSEREREHVAEESRVDGVPSPSVRSFRGGSVARGVLPPAQASSPRRDVLSLPLPRARWPLSRVCLASLAPQEERELYSILFYIIVHYITIQYIHYNTLHYMNYFIVCYIT